MQQACGYTHREVFDWLVHSTDGCNGSVWARPEPSAPDFIWICCVWQEPKHLVLLPLLSQVHLQGACSENVFIKNG